MIVGIGEIGTMANLKEKAFCTTSRTARTCSMKEILMGNPTAKEFLSSMRDRLNMRVQFPMGKLMEKECTKILAKTLNSMENSKIPNLTKVSCM